MKMKKMMVAAVAVVALGAFAQESEETDSSPAWRLTVGGFGRGSMTMRPADMPGRRFEMYGADADVQFRICDEEKFNLWTGVGFGWAPNQRIYDKTRIAGIAYNRAKDELQCGELRLLAVPEWKATESLALGLRLGAALDWTRCKALTEGGVPPFFAFSDNETYTQLLVQGIVGFQGTYMFTDNFGLYAAIDWRGGGEHALKKNHVGYGKLDMDGWYASGGMLLAF